MDENDKLKELFRGFDPDVSSESTFMMKLEHSLNSVEIVKRHSEEMESRHRKAVAMAAVVGFVAGFLCSLLLPALQNGVAVWKDTLAETSWFMPVADNIMVIGWMMVAVTSTLFALNTYDLTLSVLKSGKDDSGK